MTNTQKILIIDDDEIFLNLLGTILGDEGYEVISTADGPQGVDIFTQQKPDVVLIDLALPTMGGLEVLRKIRELDANARILVVTGHASDESEEVALHAGAAAYIAKPVRPAELLDQIGKLIGA